MNDLLHHVQRAAQAIQADVHAIQADVASPAVPFVPPPPRVLTLDELAAWFAPLAEQTVVGYTWHMNDCPVARYLSQNYHLRCLIVSHPRSQFVPVGHRTQIAHDDEVQAFLEAVDALGTAEERIAVTAGQAREFIAAVTRITRAAPVRAKGGA